MTKLVILTQNERRRFDSPPILNTNERALHFALNNTDLQIVQELRTATNKVGFVLQLGYFRSNGKFYTTEQFRRLDIEYVVNTLNIDSNKINLLSYQKKIPADHRKRILSIMHWQPFGHTQQGKISAHALWLAQRQFSPKHIFLSMIDFCWQNKIELPTYNVLALIITHSYNQYENGLINILTNKLTQYHREKIDKMLGLNNSTNKKRMERPPITLIKQINQSLKPSDIQENVKVLKMFQEYFLELKPLIEELQLSDPATEYFATWVQKSTAFQLNQFPNRNKLYLHLLCYIKHQFYFRHDMLIDIFLKSVKAVTNSASKKLNVAEKETRSERNKAIKKLSASNKDSRELIEEITKTVKSPTLTVLGKLSKVKELLDSYNVINNEIEKNNIIQSERSLNEISNEQLFLDILESMSLKLQRRVSDIVKVLEFNPNTSSADLISAISHFKYSNGDLGSDSPVNFLNEKESEALYSIKLIENYWDDVLRFMATIKLKHTSTSQLFKRLSSYAKDHPLYQAIKEFGRIIKSIFILTYFDDVELRQRIEKQLNKVELSNKFSKAVFFANNKEFQHGDPEAQKISTACKVLIQNAIVLWNYLYLSQLLVNNADINERKRMIGAIKRGSIISWQHINLHGEYDFTKHAANDTLFDIDKILTLSVA